MKISAVIVVAIASFVLTACSSNASHNVLKPEAKAQTMAKEKVKEKMTDKAKEY